jgi:hypothetical protein
MGTLPRGTALLVIGLALGVVIGTATVAVAACSVTTGDFDGNGSQDLRVIGDAANQTLRIIDAPRLGTTTLSLDCDGDGLFTNAAAGDRNGVVMGEFELFDLRLGSGDDAVTIDVPPTVAPDVTAYNKQNRNFAVQLGLGSNSFRFDHPASVLHPPPTAVDSRLTIDVQGGGGADDVFYRFIGARASLIVLRADLGAGPDRVTLTTFDIGRYEQGSVVNVDFQMDTGDDTVNYTPNADLFDGSVYRVNIVTGAGADTVNGGVFSLVSNGHLILNVDLGAGNDVLEWKPPALVGVDGSVHIRVSGGPGQDHVAFALSDPAVTSSLDGLVELLVHGDDGNDDLGVNLSPPAPGSSDVAGTVRAHVDGGAGNDTVIVSQRSSGGSAGTFDFLLRGGLGADGLELAVEGPASYAPVGAALLDGGPATDQCNVVGSALARKQNCEL